MESIKLVVNDDPVCLELSQGFKRQILENARYYKCETLPSLKLILDTTYDVSSWYLHEDGNKYGVVHTISGGGDPAQIFGDKLEEFKWEVCASNFKYKKEVIKSHFKEMGCETEIVYCLFEICPS